MQDILPVTAPIFLTIAIGYLTVRLGGLTKADVAGLGKFVINLSLPALLFRALSQNPLAEILNGAYLAAYALGSLTMLLLGTAFARFVRKQSLQASALTGMGMSSSNSGFIGYPIVLQVLGPTAGIGLALAMVVENLLVLPVFLVLAESRAAGGGSVRHALVGLRIRGLLADVTRIVGAKLLLHPLAVFAALSLLSPIDPKLRIAAVLFASSPMLTVYPIFGQKYGREDVCAAALMTATALSFASVSAVLWLMDRGGWLAVLR
ncbi:AEC family transporter [Azospirillum doebereinerae]|uniref:AEC family transporter n=1 Tax=Azospirillum doebereinerae TaxID=92933 RepID=A0A3S0WN10_9PROT|nr:AEC family transporter [Azospirillum doebereinerae]RUQ73623.1 AEC family transporter [Azospirillum doebereinerae]